MKRFRRPKLKDGELRIYFGKLPHENPDIVYAWQGESSMKQDSAFLYHYLGVQRPTIEFGEINWSKMERSFFAELEARGYDISTVEFKIKKRETPKEKVNE